MRCNSGNAILDKYGFYQYLGCSLKEIDDNTTVWIARHNPTKASYPMEEINKKDFDVYVVKQDVPKNEIVEPIMKSFKNREKAKQWINKNLVNHSN